jgi:hypothetical protein
MGCLEGTIIEPDIRCLGPQDENEFCRFLLGIEPSDRCSRFGKFVSDAYLSSHAQSALANADWIARAFVDDRLRGVVEVYRDRVGPRLLLSSSKNGDRADWAGHCF